MDAVLAYRPEQRAGKPAVAAFADHEQIRALGPAEQDAGRIAKHDQTVDRHPGVGGRGVLDGLCQRCACFSGNVLTWQQRHGRSETDGELPGVDRLDFSARRFRLFQRPTESRDRRRRAVDTHDNA